MTTTVPAGSKILIVDSETACRRWLATLVASASCTPLLSSTLEHARAIVRRELPAVVLAGLDLEDGSGVDLSAFIQQVDPTIETVLMVAHRPRRGHRRPREGDLRLPGQAVR
ncbi:MAG: hypothetical protein HY815_25490 [Candidatus Riflebacteria bacterium]|nr:hypothetical protein [Candidatus Riflebacteria bacterium]